MTIDDIKTILHDVLHLDPNSAPLQAQSGLLGVLPELDSMAVVTIIGALEERFGIVIDDDEISAANFETVATLSDFVDAKLAA